MQKIPLDSSTPTLLFATVSPFAVSPSLASTLMPLGHPSRLIIFIRHNKLVSIERLEDNTLTNHPEGWELIELPQDQLLIPALVDCHVHLVLDGLTGFNSLNGPVSVKTVQGRLEKMFHAGVMAVRDGSDRYNSAMEYLRQSSRKGINARPQIITTGQAIFRQGYYGLKLGGRGVTSAQEAIEKIACLHRAGSNQVKIVLSGLVNLKQPGSVGPLQFNLAELTQMVKTAHQYNLPVMVHASSDRAVQIALQAGVDTIEHGYYLSLESLKKMAEQKIAWIPTVAPMAALAKRMKLLGETKQANTAQQAVEQHLKMISRAYEYDVIMGIGTDAGSPGVSWEQGIFQELCYFFKAGLPPGAVLEVATKNGARLLGLSQKLGNIEPGKSPAWLTVNPEFLSFAQPEKMSPSVMIFTET